MFISEHGGNTFNKNIELDFSSNINPLGMPESIRKAVIDSVGTWEKYPDSFCTSLTEKIAAAENISENRVICGNGADELIYKIVQTLKPKHALICIPTFGEFKKALNEIGCTVKEYRTKESNNFDILSNFLNYLKSDIDMVFVCNPNNPTGRTVSPELLAQIAMKCRKEKITLVIDESFVDFLNNGGQLSAKHIMYENMIIIRSFTKMYAMPGLRLGYALFGNDITAEKVRVSGQYWNVSAPAQAAGMAALDEKEFVRRTVSLIGSERLFLSGNLASLGLKVFRSEANFILFKSEQPLYEPLLKEKILIRDCSNFDGLGEGFFRTSVRDFNDNMRLVSAIKRCLKG